VRYEPYKEGAIVIRKKVECSLGILMCLFVTLATYSYAADGNTTWQINTSLEEILKDNPVPAGAQSQMIKLAEDDTISLYLVRMLEGAELAPHYHKARVETEYVIRGTGSLFVNGTWMDIKPGSFHFNPATKVHGAKNTGKEPLIVLIMFTPAMKEPDRHFVK
jgi:quercetin dioxygenase-like cupin family protein